MNRTNAWLLVVMVLASLASRHVAAQEPSLPVVQIVDVTVDEVLTRNNKIAARGTVTLDIAGRIVVDEFQVPVRISGTPAEPCDIFNAAIGPLELNVLGMAVELDDCNNAPVTIDIAAVEGFDEFNDLVCDIAAGLVDGFKLGDILPTLTEEEISTFTSGMRDVFNELLDELLENGTESTDVNENRQRSICDIISLSIPEGVDGDLLGVQVITSGICLEVFGTKKGGDLGVLLCKLDEQLRTSFPNQEKIDRLLSRIDKILGTGGSDN